VLHDTAALAALVLLRHLFSYPSFSKFPWLSSGIAETMMILFFPSFTAYLYSNYDFSVPGNSAFIAL